MFLQNVQNLKSELWLANLHKWHDEFKIEEDETMLYRHIYLTAKEKTFISYPKIQEVANIASKFESELEICLSVEVRNYHLSMPDYRYYEVPQPSINIQISMPHDY